MRSAIAFLPSRMTVFTNFVTRRRVSTTWSVYFGSGSGLRFGTSPLRGIALLPIPLLNRELLGALGAVLGAALASVGHARRIERPANDVVAHARQILHATPADEDDRVLLEVVALTRDIGGDLHPVREAHAGDLAKGRVRLLWRGRINAHAYAATLRTRLQRRRIR